VDTRDRAITPDLFVAADVGHYESEKISGEKVGFWGDAWRRLFKNKAAVVGLAVILVLMALAAVVPLLTPYTLYQQDLTRRYTDPTLQNSLYFGTDQFGRDMLTRVWEGTRVSLYIAFLAAAIDLFVGVPYGAISGLLGGRVDSIMQRGLEILVGIPSLVIAILVMLILEPGILTLSIAIGATGWTSMARIIRGRVLQLKNQEFTLASRSLGAGSRWLLVKHLLPNSLGLIIITMMLTIPSAIFYEAVLSFIGLGIQVPNASLGALIDDGAGQLRFHPYLLWFPAAVFALLMISFNLLADGLRDALDPRMRR
jgi:oligopeptide transport system permease protein